MTQSEVMSNLLEISENSYYRWKKKDHIKLITLIEKYFTTKDLEEFIQSSKINKFENINYIQEYFIETKKDRYIQNFKANNSSLMLIIGNEYIADFYFDFLTNLKSKKNFFSTTDYEYESYFIERYDFNKALSDYIFENQQKEFEKKNFEIRLLSIKEEKEAEHEYFIKDIEEFFPQQKNETKKDEIKLKNNDFNFDEEKEKQNLIKEIIEHSQKQFEHIYNHLSFIQHWDNDMYFFINFLIKTDFELFINSGDDELLYHAIGFLVYSKNNLHTDKVEEIFKFFRENKDKINNNIIKDIILNPEKLNELKKYKIIEKYFTKIKQEVTEEEIHRIILDSVEFEKIDKELEEIITKEKNDEIMNNLLNLQKEEIKI